MGLHNQLFYTLPALLESNKQHFLKIVLLPEIPKIYSDASLKVLKILHFVQNDTEARFGIA
jgi:hypothetical protein